ncbi:hypothetical protein [Kaistia terrae]|uniref:ABM domain-containing protein n=1 Tax=Kaistia terrae TaxID=537017 RepID=A0ABW0Q2C6_9HYPH|nr:hypothetical protein [Kaistia terrae]MCX5579618.1 hypothetical protein [Kaistia terrae]
MKAISRGASFDIFPSYEPAEAERIIKINSDRTERFRRDDDRPTSPPVPDRPEDQVWPFGDAIFYVARFSGSPDTEAFSALVDAAGDQVVAPDRLLGGPQRDQVNYGAVIRFANEDAWRAFAASPAMKKARDAGLYRDGAHQAFFVTDPANDALAGRLRAALAGG